ncbi:BAG domain-containing protein Samui [Camponotus floridanus]|uniref:BAG domain-containing protein Samui n=1 Tax=Camponotus floridanus TaxID=104421 RepID=E1ZV09_CAMFO|nr:BAG domain-containing protein Samui [Camponotus floridanus]
MSFYFRDSPKFADRLRGIPDDELLREVKERFNEDNEDAFLDSSRRTRGDSFDRPFPHFPRGFPFDDETDVFERRRGDGIRAHLDDLAARHPELAEHLRGPPWPFGGSLLRDRRHRRRDSGGSANDGQQHQQSGQQHQVDEDARSQASGSSAASGASAVSSHSGGEPDLTSSSAIPQYGLRNTVDIGQQQRRRNMETSPEKSERGQRSMSAPPENRQQQQQQQQHGQGQQQQSVPGQGQRFVSRVDITPQHNQQQRAQSPGKPSSNVRHIPIFVEGRDEPVMSKLTDDTSPPAFHHQQRQPSPPHFHRPSHFNEHFGRQQWPPSHFQNAFYEPKVDNLAEQVRRYVGGSRQDKEYIYLDEMLTRELLKLDDIETEGRENVRQARKNAIKTIQDTISLLETKAPLTGQQQPVLREEEECPEQKDQQEEKVSQVPELMDVDVKQEKQANEPIPLPPAPSSPTKTKESSENENAATAVESTNQNVAPAVQQDIKINEKNEQKVENRTAENIEQVNAPMEHEKETSNEKDGDATQNKDTTPKQQTEETKKEKMESPEVQKKAKKTKKKEQQQQQQQPVSEQAIPLPPPSTEDTKK